VGVVAIGRNEGARLRRCLDALPSGLGGVVYVDSASEDDSVEQARRRGADVVALDLSLPFTAARARNAGLRRLVSIAPGLRFVQFLDGDCALAPGWIAAALGELEADAELAVVCGRRREIAPGASPYNRLADMEWDAPAGDTAACGGDALARVAPILAAGGYDERLVAGEEPELCARLRARGWRIRRIAREMTAHDAAMTRFSQWWRRSVRSGYGFAQAGAASPGLYRRERRSAVAWALAPPLAAAIAAPWAGPAAVAALLLYPLLFVRVFLRRSVKGARAGDAALYAAFCVIGKLPEALGVARHARDRLLGRRARLIEYKQRGP
jgi:glycosyltransferase involved in cell wall biosynthesis